MKLKNKIISFFVATILSLGTVLLPANFADTAITISAESYSDKVESITKIVDGTDVTLYWDGVTSADGYKLYKKCSDGSFKKYSSYKIKKQKDGRFKCIISNLKKNKTYTFAVAPTKKSKNDKNIAGDKTIIKLTTATRLTSLKSPSDICDYLSYIGMNADMKSYQGITYNDDHTKYFDYLTDLGLYLKPLDPMYQKISHGEMYGYAYNVYSDEEKTNRIGRFTLVYSYMDDDSVLVTIGILPD